MSKNKVWRTCMNCGQRIQVDDATYKAHPLIVFCPMCNMNKAGEDKDAGRRNKK